MNWLNLVLSGVVSSIIAVFSISNFSKEKLNLKNILIFICIMAPLGILVCAFFSGITKLILTIIVLILSLNFSLFYKDINKSVYYAIVYELFVIIIEILLSIMFVTLLQNQYDKFSFSLFIFSLCNSLLILIVSKIKFIQNNVIKLNKFISKNNNEWIYIGIIMLLLICLLTFNRYNLDNNVNFYINAGMVIFVLLSLIYVISNKFSKQRYEDKYNQMMEYVCKYENIINEQGKKNHEYNNQLMVISGYADNPEKLKEYLKLVMEEHKVGQNYMVKQLGCFPNGGIKGLMYNKLGQIEECKIKPYFYIDPSIKDIFETKFDLNTYRDITKLLGVYIDNAIDAAKDANPKEIELEMKVDDRYLTITISNTYNKNVDINKVGKKGFSTKGSGHGFGLSIVKDIAKNNDKIETFSDPDEKMYKQVIIIDLK